MFEIKDVYITNKKACMEYVGVYIDQNLERALNIVASHETMKFQTSYVCWFFNFEILLFCKLI